MPIEDVLYQESYWYDMGRGRRLVNAVKHFTLALG